MTLDETPDANRIATAVADKCSQFRASGQPKAPNRYAVIWQAARLGAIAALSERQNATLNPDAVADVVAALESIQEYWNRDRNDEAMFDACWHAIDTATTALARIRGEG